MPTHWNESALGIFAATLNSGDALVVIQHIARLTEAACLADGRDFGAGALTVGIRIQAGRQTGGQAVGQVAVGWAWRGYRMEVEWC